jgi:hypothetical protein
MNTTEAFGLTYDVPCSNGQLEPAYTYRPTAPTLIDSLYEMTDDQWLILRGKVDGRVAGDIDESLQSNVNYLRAYVEGAMCAINARLLMPSRLADAEVPILLEWAQFTAATVRRLRALDEELNKVGEF